MAKGDGVVSSAMFAEWCDALGYAQAEMAKALEVSPRSIVYYRTGGHVGEKGSEVPWHVWLACCAIANDLEADADAMVERPGCAWLAKVPRSYRLASMAMCRGVAGWTLADGVDPAVIRRRQAAGKTILVHPLTKR